MFTRAGATARVFQVKKGKAVDLGPAWSGLVAPWTTLAVVPTTPIIVNYSVEARTADAQPITVNGTVTVTLDPDVARLAFDMAVDHQTGSYREPWQRQLQSMVAERVLGPIRTSAKQLGVVAALAAQPEIEAAITDATKNDATLTKSGIAVTGVSVFSVEADGKVLEAAGAKELQAMLAAADKAMHDRREKAASNDRAIKKLESETAELLEKERAKLVAARAENELAQAKADAEALKTRLEPFGEVEPEKALAAALIEMAKRGVSSINIGPELLAALRGGAK